MCIYKLRKHLDQKTAAKFDVKIHLPASYSLFHPTVFGKEYEA
jgi:hypothetical protein